MRFFVFIIYSLQVYLMKTLNPKSCQRLQNLSCLFYKQSNIDNVSPAVIQLFSPTITPPPHLLPKTTPFLYYQLCKPSFCCEAPPVMLFFTFWETYRCSDGPRRFHWGENSVFDHKSFILFHEGEINSVAKMERYNSNVS